MRRRILYVENGMHGGGSAESLFQLLAVLDRSLFEPVVVFTSPIPAQQRIANFGIKTHVLDNWYFSRQVGRVREALAWGASALVVHGARILPWASLALDRALTAPLRARLADLIRRENIDLVHTNNNPHRDLWALEAAAGAGVPCVAHLRSFHSLGFSACRAERANRAVSAYVGYSDSILEHWRAAGLDARRMHLVHNAIGAVEADPVDLTSAYGIPPGAPVLGIVGRVIPERGHDVLIRALPELVKRFPGLRLLVVGGGGKADLDSLAVLVHGLGMSDHVVFTGHRKNAAGIIAALDALVLPYHIEPFGRTLLESWLIGTPVVLSRVGHIERIVTDGSDALLFTPNDPRDLAAILGRLLVDGSLAQYLAAAGRRTCLARFSVAAQRDALQRLYVGFLEQSPEGNVREF